MANPHGVAGVYQVVDQDADTIRHVANEHHTRVLTLGDLGRAAFLAESLVTMTILETHHTRLTLWMREKLKPWV